MLQQSLEASQASSRHSRHRVHKLYRSFCRKFESDMQPRKAIYKPQKGTVSPPNYPVSPVEGVPFGLIDLKDHIEFSANRSKDDDVLESFDFDAFLADQEDIILSVVLKAYVAAAGKNYIAAL